MMTQVSRYKLTLSYDGQAFFGWQVQPEDRTVQGVLQENLEKLLQEKITVTGCGRTDRGVHASHYVAHFDAQKELDNLLYRLNKMLPDEVIVHECTPVSADFHARYAARWRTYRYHISNKRNPFTYRYRWVQPFEQWNWTSIQEGSEMLKKYDDFQAMSKRDDNQEHYQCQVVQAQWDRQDDELVFTITARRFLHNMVRRIVGGLADLGQGKISLTDWESALKDGKPLPKSLTAPPQGLFLAGISYEEALPTASHSTNNG